MADGMRRFVVRDGAAPSARVSPRQLLVSPFRGPMPAMTMASLDGSIVDTALPRQPGEPARISDVVTTFMPAPTVPTSPRRA